MIDKLFTLLQHNPLVSTIGLMLLTAFLAWLFREEIKLYIKKKWNLYTPSEVHSAVIKAQEINNKYSVDANIDTLAVLVVDNLEHEKKI